MLSYCVYWKNKFARYGTEIWWRCWVKPAYKSEPWTNRKHTQETITPKTYIHIIWNWTHALLHLLKLGKLHIVVIGPMVTVVIVHVFSIIIIEWMHDMIHVYIQMDKIQLVITMRFGWNACLMLLWLHQLLCFLRKCVNCVLNQLRGDKWQSYSIRWFFFQHRIMSLTDIVCDN